MAKTVTPSPKASPKGKGKEPEMEIFLDHEVMVKLAKDFARGGYLVRKCLKKWKRRVTDRAMYAEAFARSESYTERLQRERMSSSVSSATSRASDASVKRQRGLPDVSPPAKTRPPRKSAEFQPRRTDEALSRTLKEVRIVVSRFAPHELTLVRLCTTDGARTRTTLGAWILREHGPRACRYGSPGQRLSPALEDLAFDKRRQ